MYNNNNSGGQPRRNPRVTLILGLIMAAFAIYQYSSRSTKNEVTGEKQHLGNITDAQQVALGLQAAPQTIEQYGGESNDAEAQQLVDEVGNRLVAKSDASKSVFREKFQFHLLADKNTINAFALPGGQVFVTEALFRRLKTEGELAGVIGHEIGHVVEKHGAEHIAKQQLVQGLTGAAALASWDPNDPRSGQKAAVAAAVGQLVSMKFGRDDELQSDTWGVRTMAQAGYDPRSMVGVMKILAAAGAGGRQPEFLSTHPNPENRIPKIKAAIKAAFPNGVPDGLAK
jgi:beta-barrel assembly-enhancing protease